MTLLSAYLHQYWQLVFLEIAWGVSVHFNLTDPITPALRRVLLLVLCFNQFQDHGRYGALKSSKTLTTKTLERPKDWKTIIFFFFSPLLQMMFGICAAPAAVAGAKNLDPSMAKNLLHSWMPLEAAFCSWLASLVIRLECFSCLILPDGLRMLMVSPSLRVVSMGIARHSRWLPWRSEECESGSTSIGLSFLCFLMSRSDKSFKRLFAHSCFRRCDHNEKMKSSSKSSPWFVKVGKSSQPSCQACYNIRFHHFAWFLTSW